MKEKHQEEDIIWTQLYREAEEEAAKEPILASYAVGWGFLIGWGLIMFGEITRDLDDLSPLVAIIFLVSSYILKHVIRRWRAWKMALILALDFFSVIMLLVACDEIFSGRSEEFAMLVAGCAATWLLCLGWMRLGLLIFDRGMAGEMQ